MDITSIRIQFVTLAKTIHRNKSVCYLEVIPNVTNVENIEKIEWKSENDKTEYILPINYKIILKKVDPTGIGESQKMYYSCVDLLQTPVSSIHNVELGSGDISRIVSDTNFVQDLTKTTMQGKANEKLKIKQKATKNCNKNLKLECPEEKNEYSQKVVTVTLARLAEHIRERSFIYLHDNVFDRHSNIISENSRFAGVAKKTTSVQIKISTEGLKDYKVKRIASEESEALEANIMNPVSVETLTDLNAILEKKSKFTITSVICEEDTKIRPLLRTVYQNTSFSKTSKHTLCTTKNYTVKENMIDFQQNTTVGTRNIATRRSCKASMLNPVMSRFCSEYKITTALRLSNFIQLIEREMLPLRITLNEIVNKCIPLGLPLKCKLLHDLETYEYDPRACTLQKCCRQTRLPSNRGVYSVVFNKY